MHVPAQRMTRFRRVDVPPRHTHARRAGPHVSHTNIQTKSRESHMLCLLTGIPLAPSARQRVLVPQSPPSPQMRAGGGSVFFHAAKATPSLAPRAGQRGFFFSCCHLPPPASTPALRQRPQSLHAGSTPPRAGSAPPMRAGSMPPHTASAPCPCTLGRGPWPCAKGQRPCLCVLIPPACAPCRYPWPAHCVDTPSLRTVSIPPACAPCRCAWPARRIDAPGLRAASMPPARALHQHPHPCVLHLHAVLHLHPCLCKCLEGIISCSF